MTALFLLLRSLGMKLVYLGVTLDLLYLVVDRVILQLVLFKSFCTLVLTERLDRYPQSTDHSTATPRA